MSVTPPVQKTEAPAAPQSWSIYHRESVYPSHQYKKAIESINAEMIETIAINVIAPVLAELDVGMEDFYGVNFQQKECSQNSAFMKAALPFFIKQIQDAFANGESFAENGIKFQVFDLGSTGILNQMASTLAESDKRLLEQAIQTHLKEAKTLCVTLQISHNHPPENLCFTYEMHIDETKTYSAATGFEGFKKNLEWGGLTFGDLIPKEEGMPITVYLLKGTNRKSV